MTRKVKIYKYTNSCPGLTRSRLTVRLCAYLEQWLDAAFQERARADFHAIVAKIRVLVTGTRT